VGALTDRYVRVGPESRAEAVGSTLAAVMSQRHRLALAALGDDGFRIPMPEYEELTGGAVVAQPPDRATMADLVVPEDRMTVVTTWEQARRYGAATGSARLVSDPSRPARLTILDTRARYGTWLAVVARDDGEAPGPAGDQWLPTPARPRSATVRLDMFAVIRAMDDRATRMLGWAPEQMVGVRSLEFCHPDDQQRAIDAWMQLLGDKTVQRLRARRMCSDGSWLWVESELTYVEADDPDHVEVVAQLSDISAEMAAYEALHRREEVFRRLAESVPVGLVQAGLDGRVTYSNAKVAHILGLPPEREFERLDDVFADEARAAVYDALTRACAEGTDQELELTVHRPATAEPRYCAISIVCLSGEGQSEALICMNDVTEEAVMRRELEERATFDPLTRCYNRSATMEAVEAALRRQGAGKTGALFIDLDSFKDVNDRLGHAAGDQLLACVGERLATSVRGNDIVGRLGGDEFLVLCRELSGTAPLLAVAARVRRALARPVLLGAGPVTVRASMGACYAEHELTADELVARADSAMYESKRQGAGRLVLFGAVHGPASL